MGELLHAKERVLFRRRTELNKIYPKERLLQQQSTNFGQPVSSVESTRWLVAPRRRRTRANVRLPRKLQRRGCSSVGHTAPTFPFFLQPMSTSPFGQEKEFVKMSHYDTKSFESCQADRRPTIRCIGRHLGRHQQTRQVEHVQIVTVLQTLGLTPELVTSHLLQ